jgi:hypothetical protein
MNTYGAEVSIFIDSQPLGDLAAGAVVTNGGRIGIDR